jgi:hypothetical protein
MGTLPEATHRISSGRVNKFYGEDATTLVMGAYQRFLRSKQREGVLLSAAQLDRFASVVNVERKYSEVFMALQDIVLNQCGEYYRMVIIAEESVFNPSTRKEELQPVAKLVGR